MALWRGTPIVISFGTVEIDTNRRELRRDGAVVGVEPKVLDLLLHLIEERVRVVSRDDLIAAVWQGRIVSDAALSTAIRSARMAVGDDGTRQAVIKTLHGRGFRFVAPLEVVGQTSPTEQALSPPMQGPSIAVLPFQNLCSDSDQDYFVDGICTEIITALSGIRWLLVIARNSTFSFKGQAVDVRQVGLDLDVRYVLEGSVAKAGSRVRVTAQLVEAQTANQIWAARFDRDLTDIFALQDEITGHIVGALEPQMSAAEHKRTLSKPDQNLDAWDFVLRAMDRVSEFTNVGSAEALALLDRALAVDPRYARALGQKAWITVWRIHQGWGDPDVDLPSAISAAEQAIARDPEEVWAHIAWGFIGSILKDAPLILSSIEQAIGINPNSAIAHSYMGAVYAVTGRAAETFDCTERARRLSPRDVFRDQFEVHDALAHFQLANYEAATLSSSNAMRLRPEHVYPRLIAAAAYGHLSDANSAKVHLLKVAELVPGFSLEHARKGCVYVHQPDIDRFVDGLHLAGLR